MLKITFNVYSKTLNKSYEHMMCFKSMSDYRLYCYSLYSYLPAITEVEYVK